MNYVAHLSLPRKALPFANVEKILLSSNVSLFYFLMLIGVCLIAFYNEVHLQMGYRTNNGPKTQHPRGLEGEKINEENTNIPMINTAFTIELINVAPAFPCSHRDEGSNYY